MNDILSLTRQRALTADALEACWLDEAADEIERLMNCPEIPDSCLQRMPGDKLAKLASRIKHEQVKRTQRKAK